MASERWQKIGEIFQAALDRDPAERAAFLDEACASDAALRGEIESLIAADERAGSFIDPDALKDRTELPKDDQAESVIGSLIGPYKVIREIGRGGMGVVYLATRADDQYQKRVAIKVVRPGLNTRKITRRFRNERQILAALDHPNIARLLDGGTTRDGLPYFVMEYIKGKPITGYCDDHKLNTTERLKLFRGVCSAVQYAHQNLIVHRDIKPGNILITAEGVPKLLDFGIAKLLNPELGFQTIDPTATAMQMMTPDYASPEQARGENITTASDLYSLGVVLYELLTGHRPHCFKSRMPHEVLRVICEQEPEKPSTAITRVGEASPIEGASRMTITPQSVSKTREGEPEKLRRRLAGDLDNIVLKALRKEAARRYRSVEQLSEDIGRHLEGRPVIARKDTLAYRSGKFIKRHKAGVMAAVLILMVLVGGVAATLWQARLAGAQRARAERRFNDVRKLANTFMFELHDEIKNIAGTTRARMLMVRSALEYLDSLAQEAGDDPSLQRELATAYEKVGDVQGNPASANLGDTAGALDSYRKALSIREALLAAEPANPENNRDLANIYRRVGNMLRVTGDTAGALESYRKALEVGKALSSTDPTNVDHRIGLAVSYGGVGRMLGATGDGAGALENHRKALEIYETLAATDPANVSYRIDLAAIYIGIGHELAAAGDTVGALENYRRAQKIFEHLVATDPTNALSHHDLAYNYTTIGYLLTTTGDVAAGLETLGKALRIIGSLAEADPTNTQARRSLGFGHYFLGGALAKAGDKSEALKNYRKALMIFEALSAADPTNVDLRRVLADTCNKVGDQLTEVGHADAAVDSHSRAIAILERLVAAHPNNPELFSDLAISYATLGDMNARLASERKNSVGQRIELLSRARMWYKRSLDIYFDLGNRGRLSSSDAGRPDRIAQEIDKCDKAIEKLKGH